MKSEFEKLLDEYSYDIPTHLIATTPSSPRDSAKLLVYDRSTDEQFFDTFLNLDTYIGENSVLVLNETKVIPARVPVRKETGGEARILYLGTEKNYWKVLSDKKLRQGSKVFVTPKIYFSVTGGVEPMYFLTPSFKIGESEKILMKYGTTPIPRYIKNTTLSEKKLRKKYQTIFAQTSGSVAAPTASLHFTNRLFNKLKRKGVTIAYITLHVNLGTFDYLTEKQIHTGTLHAEYFEVPAKTVQIIEKAKKDGRKIVAVGTTVVRTLESASDKSGKIVKTSGETNLFIRNDYRMKCVDEMITNFHVPRSSLLMLVSTLVPTKKLLSLYEIAMRKKFRFFSFGDGMYIR